MWGWLSELAKQDPLLSISASLIMMLAGAVGVLWRQHVRDVGLSLTVITAQNKSNLTIARALTKLATKIETAAGARGGSDAIK